MEPSNNEKGRAEQRRPVWIAREPQAFMKNKLVPLVGLTAQEDHSPEDRQANEFAKRIAVVALDGSQSLHHPHTTDNQQEGHASRQPDPQNVIWLRPVGTAIAYRAIPSQEGAK